MLSLRPIPLPAVYVRGPLPHPAPQGLTSQKVHSSVRSDGVKPWPPRKCPSQGDGTGRSTQQEAVEQIPAELWTALKLKHGPSDQSKRRT